MFDPTIWVMGIIATIIAGTVTTFMDKVVIDRMILGNKPVEPLSDQSFVKDVNESHGREKIYASQIPWRNLPGIVVLIISIFLPPLAVYMEKGPGSALWTNLCLTILGFYPGIFHALFVVLSKRVLRWR